MERKSKSNSIHTGISHCLLPLFFLLLGLSIRLVWSMPTTDSPATNPMQPSVAYDRRFLDTVIQTVDKSLVTEDGQLLILLDNESSIISVHAADPAGEFAAEPAFQLRASGYDGYQAPRDIILFNYGDPETYSNLKAFIAYTGNIYCKQEGESGAQENSSIGSFNLLRNGTMVPVSGGFYTNSSTINCPYSLDTDEHGRILFIAAGNRDSVVSLDINSDSESLLNDRQTLTNTDFFQKVGAVKYAANLKQLIAGTSTKLSSIDLSEDELQLFPFDSRGSNTSLAFLFIQP